MKTEGFLLLIEETLLKDAVEEVSKETRTTSDCPALP